jgi:aspartate/methionine/tyrosine aminotransferase
MKKFTPSATGKMSARAQELKAQGIKIYDFAAGDPVIENHPVILEAVSKALESKMSPYAPVAGLSELRMAACAWMHARYACSYSIENTLVTSGGKFGLYAALQVLLSPGDEVLISAPYWVSYPEMVVLAGGVPVLIPTDPENQWKFSLADLKKHIRPRTKILLFNNACNPTGALYSKEEIRAILDFAHQAKLFVISDEVYSELVFDAFAFISCASFPEYQEGVLIIESCSKNFAMAGWRVGFAFGKETLIQKMTALQSHSTTGTAGLSQKAALGALSHAKTVASYVREIMRQRRDLFFQTYNTLFHTHATPPSASIYFFAPMGKDSNACCEEILTRAHVALVPGLAFGREGYVRFAFSQNESEITQGLKVLANKVQNF